MSTILFLQLFRRLFVHRSATTGKLFAIEQLTVPMVRLMLMHAVVIEVVNPDLLLTVAAVNPDVAPLIADYEGD